MPNRLRYSQWDGTQDIPALDPDDVLAGLTDDLMNFGDLQHALRNMLQRGMRTPDGSRTQGLRDLLQQLRQQRRQTLDRFDLSSAFDDIQQQIDEILELERDTLDTRHDEAQRNLPPPAAPEPDSPTQPDPAPSYPPPPHPAHPAPSDQDQPGNPVPLTKPPNSPKCSTTSSNANSAPSTISPTTPPANSAASATTNS